MRRCLQGLLLLVLAGCGCSQISEERAPQLVSGDDVESLQGGGPLVLLVSLDTTRADALGCYADVAGWGLDLREDSRPLPETPVLDRLAASGLRAKWALAHAPTTLSSHASVFSGRDPLGHGVYRNGVPISLSLPLVTEELGSLGFETMAVVGASVLDRSMGLNRGFDLYDDQVTQVVRARTEDSADAVNARVLDAMMSRQDPGRPLFLFVHYFDAHSPWTSADSDRVTRFTREGYQGILQDGRGESIGQLSAFASKGMLGIEDRIRARGLYLAEVSHVDHALGELLEQLESGGYLDESLVVVFGDHGEILDEVPDRAYGHGTDVDLAAIHVPLILSAQGRFAESLPDVKTLDSPVSLRDIPATILDVLDGRSSYQEGWTVLPSNSTEPRERSVHFAEATKPHGTGPLWPNSRLERAVVRGDALYLRAPWLGESGQLYRLAPGQPLWNHASLGHELAGLLDAWAEDAPTVEPLELDPQMRSNLEALGYLE